MMKNISDSYSKINMVSYHLNSFSQFLKIDIRYPDSGPMDGKSELVAYNSITMVTIDLGFMEMASSVFL